MHGKRLAHSERSINIKRTGLSQEEKVVHAGHPTVMSQALDNQHMLSLVTSTLHPPPGLPLTSASPNHAASVW